MPGSFEELRERLNMSEVVTYYGFHIEWNDMAKCPFHDDRPSAKLYTDRLHCFTCARSWDAVSFVGELFGLRPIGAAQKLDADFRLGLFPDRPIAGAPICAATDKSRPGYYLAADADELERYISALTRRVDQVELTRLHCAATLSKWRETEGS